MASIATVKSYKSSCFLIFVIPTSHHTTLPPIGGRCAPHFVLSISTSSNPRPPSASSVCVVGTGSNGLLSHTSSRTTTPTKPIRNRITITSSIGPGVAEPSTRPVCLTAFVTSSDVNSSIVSMHCLGSLQSRAACVTNTRPILGAVGRAARRWVRLRAGASCLDVTSPPPARGLWAY
jgi:hypothetical protein